MPWNPNTKIMTTPIGMGDISQAVNYASGDLGTLIKNGAINKWAKFKPVREYVVGTFTRYQLRHLGFDSVPTAMTVGELVGFYTQAAHNPASDSSAHGWVYARPRGNSVNPTEWYRMLDFDGYNANAKNPFGTVFYCANAYSRGGQLVAFTSRYYPVSGVPDSDLVIADINECIPPAWQMLYFGVVFRMVLRYDSGVPVLADAWKMNGNTNEHPINRGHTVRGDEYLSVVDDNILFDSSWGDGVEYMAYPFLTNIPFSGWIYGNALDSSVGDRGLFPIPGLDPTIIMLYSFAVRIVSRHATVGVIVSGDEWSSDAYVEIENRSSSPVTITGVTWKCRIPGNNFLSPLVAGERQGTLSDITIPGNTTVRVPSGSSTITIGAPSTEANMFHFGFYFNQELISSASEVRVPYTP